MKRLLLMAAFIFICINAVGFAQGNYGFELIGRALPGEATATFVVNDRCYLGAGDVLQVLDISNPASPIYLGQLSLPGTVEDVYVVDSLAYIADDDGGLIIANISNPSQIERLGQLDFSDDAFGIYANSDYAYVAGLNAGFNIVDVSNPINPVQVSSFPVEWAALNVDVQDTIACVACGYGGLYIMNVANPEIPVHLGLIDTHNTWAYDVKINGNYAYMAYSLYVGGGGLKVIDISNPSNPIVVGDCPTSTAMRRIDYANGNVFGAAILGGMHIFNVSNPGSPGTVGGWHQGYGNNISYYDENIYLSGAEEGLRIFNASNVNFPTLVSTYHTFSACQYTAIAGQYAYVVEQPSGFKVIDISNPTAPIVAYSNQIFEGGTSSAVSVVDNKLYISNYRSFGGGDHDFRVYGLDNPAQPGFLGIYDDLNLGVRGHLVRNDLAYLSNSGNFVILDVRNPDNIELVNTLYGGWDSAHKMDLVGDTIYLATMSTGLRILDITNEASPVIIGEFDTEGETFSAKYHDGLVYLADYDQGLRIIDVTNVSNPHEINDFGYGLYESCVDVAILEKSGRSYAIICFDDEIVSLNITDPFNPVQVGCYKTGDPKGLLVHGDTVYVADRDYGFFILRLDPQVDAPECENPTLPGDLLLARNYPNPFNSSTVIEFTMPEKGWVSVDIFNILGQNIASPLNGSIDSGIKTITWDGKDFAGQPMSSGVYFYRITTAEKTSTQRMTLLK